jgi:CBS domain-containing protein
MTDRRLVVQLSQGEAKMKEGIVTLRVEDVMVKEVMTTDENVTVKEAADAMNKFEIGCLIAVRKGKAMGILTERDILRRIVAGGKDAAKTKVKTL